ncbi:MAG: PilT/PilU family type 4a pilus ATPase [Deltaproteobacteria bacterium]|nr:PilT/PilU family type 4a pilus ATPase [Deltaproteobacteria bacterium]
MSKIDGFLRLATTQSADEVVLREGAPPALRVAGVLRKLSMPALDGALVKDILREAVGDHADARDGDERCVAATGLVRVRWKSGDRLEVILSRLRQDAGIELPRAQAPSFSPAPAPAPSSPAPLVEPSPPRAASSAASSAAPSGARPSRTSGVVVDRSRLAELCFAALDAGASDLVLVEGRAAAIKVHGAMVPMGHELGEGELLGLLAPWLGEAHRARFERAGDVDLAVAIPRGDRDVRFRCSLFRAMAGASAVLRPIRGDAPTLAELRLPDDVARFAELREGLVLFTGAAGSGKSTSLVAMVEHLSRLRAVHVVTIEDPIEYVFSGGRGVIHQREIGAHVPTFAEGLRAALRESPDVILLGEMRDPETIAAAVTAAETGHLVLSTLHAGSAASAIERVVDAFPEHTQRNARGRVADVLRAVVTQRLLPARDGGRVPALEILPANAAVASLIREGKTYQLPGVLQTGREAGMVPMGRAIADWVRAGVVARDVALVHAPDPQHLLAQLGR